MLIVAHATTSVPSFEEIGEDVPEALGAVIMRCLCRDPAGRYGSARKLLEAPEDCACGSKWTWRDAEDWWNRNSPRSTPSGDTGTFDATATLKCAQTTAQTNLDRTVLNYELPTEVYEVESDAVHGIVDSATFCV